MFLAACLPFAAQAGVISGGNVSLSTSDNGANSVDATGGGVTNFVNILNSSIYLTGDSGQNQIIDIQDSDYTVTNYGNLLGTDHNGIDVNGYWDFRLNNYQDIQGGSAIDQAGVLGLGDGSSIYNYEGALITGNYDAIQFESWSYDGYVYNEGVISGDTLNADGASDGIRGGNELTVDNYGTIEGYDNGISANYDLNVYNGVDGVIYGHNGAAIYSDSDMFGDSYAVIDNYGQITADNDDGIYLDGDHNTINNYDGASIIGHGGDGINADDYTTVHNDGLIAGYGDWGQGVDLDYDGHVYNNENGQIYGNNDAVRIGNSGYVQNYGTIAGYNDGSSDWSDGIAAGDGLEVYNYGSIYGDHKGVNVSDGLSLYNYDGGSITGNYDVAISAENRAYIWNDGSGEITSNWNTAIEVEDNANIYNYGNITGEDGHGIYFYNGDGASSYVHNYGSIEGWDGWGIYGNDASQYVTNQDGYIYGSDGAINLGAGNDSVTLDGGSLISGDIDLGADSDTLFFGNGQYDWEDDQNIVFGNIYGVETMFKDGSGTALVGNYNSNGYNIEADNIYVDGGSLYLNGDVYGQSGNSYISVNNGAELGGTSSSGWDADIDVNEGVISAGYTPIDLIEDLPNDGYKAVGQLTINGDVNHSYVYDTYLRVNINPQADVDFTNHFDAGVDNGLIVNNGYYDTGNMGIIITPTNPGKVISDGIYTVIDSNNTLSGNYANSEIFVQHGINGALLANTMLASFTTVGTEDSNTNLVLAVQHNYAGMPGLTPNQAALGAAIDNEVNSGDAATQEFIADLDYGTAGNAQNVIAVTEPSSKLFGLTSTILNGNNHMNSTARQHLLGLRGADTRKVGVSFGQRVSDAMKSSNVTAWGSVSFDSLSYDASNSTNNYDGDSGAFTAGVDWRLNSELALGFMINGSRSNIDGSGFGSDIDSYNGAVYGTWGGAMGLYSDFLVGYGSHTMDSSRDVVGPPGVAKADIDAQSFQVMATVGYTMGNDTIKHGPFGGFEYQTIAVDGYTEKGPLPAVSVRDYDVDSLRALLGYRVDANFGTFRPYASVAYAHEFEDGANSATAVFASTPFRISGGEQSSAFILSAGTGISLTSALTLDVGYRGEIATDDGLSSHGGTIGVNYSF